MRTATLVMLGYLAAVAAATTGGPLRVTIQTPVSQVAGVVADRELRVGDRTLSLSAVRSVEPSVVTLANGAKLAGRVSGLESVEVLIGGVPCKVDLSQATRVSITRERATTTVGRAADGPAISPPQVPRGRAVIRLPAVVDDIAVGGGGRFVILYLGKLQKLAVFDVNAGRITKFLPVAGEELLLAASMDKLLVVYPQREIIQRWDLRTLEKEVTVRLPTKPVRAVAMGYASAGPLLLNGRLIDPYTMSEIECAYAGGAPWGRDIAIQAGGNGRTFGGWSSMCGYWVGNLTGKTLTWRDVRASSAMKFAVPSFDGHVVLTTDGAYLPDGKPANVAQPRSRCLPACDGNFYVTCRYARPRKPGSRPPMDASLHLIGDKRVSIPLPPLEDMGPRSSETDLLTLRKRFLVIPRANLIAAVPVTCDRLVLRQFDVVAALDRTGLPYLFVSSVPTPGAQGGTLYEYQIIVCSKKGGVSLTLDSGPPGMALSPAGKLTWPVPAVVAHRDVPVIVRVQDASAQQVFHAFNILVR